MQAGCWLPRKHLCRKALGSQKTTDWNQKCTQQLYRPRACWTAETREPVKERDYFPLFKTHEAASEAFFPVVFFPRYEWYVYTVWGTPRKIRNLKHLMHKERLRNLGCSYWSKDSCWGLTCYLWLKGGLWESDSSQGSKLKGWEALDTVAAKEIPQFIIWNDKCIFQDSFPLCDIHSGITY